MRLKNTIDLTGTPDREEDIHEESKHSSSSSESSSSDKEEKLDKNQNVGYLVNSFDQINVEANESHEANTKQNVEMLTTPNFEDRNLYDNSRQERQEQVDDIEEDEECHSEEPFIVRQDDIIRDSK
jgi:hypothetical protein